MEPLLDLEIIESIRSVGRGDGDDFARELLALFAEQSGLTTRDLALAVAAGDLGQIRHLAHRLKGSAANIGACRLSHQAEMIERASLDGAADEQLLLAFSGRLTDLRERSLQALAPLLLGEAPLAVK